jgi:hypothetical protein
MDTSSSDRLLRGGSWNNNPRNCRSAYRNHNEPDNANNNVGFRVVCLPQKGAAGLSSPLSPYRLLRGGSWSSFPRLCRSAYRLNGLPPVNRVSNFGFRVCCLPQEGTAGLSSPLSPSAFRERIKADIAKVRSHGWGIDAAQLQRDLDACADSLKELSVVKQDTKAFLDAIYEDAQ